MIKRSKKTRDRNRLIKKLDMSCRQDVVIDRDRNTCQKCQLQNGDWDPVREIRVVIQWCHVQTREYRVLRWEECNSLALCAAHHVWFDQHKVQSYEWFRSMWPERWEQIQNVLRMPCKTSDAWIREKAQHV